MRAYKGFHKTGSGNLVCLSKRYHTEGVNRINGDVRLCVNGMHACHNLHQVFVFYPNNGNNVFYEVECGGEIAEGDEHSGKFACSELKLIREIDTKSIPRFDSCQIDNDGFSIITDSKRYKYNYIDRNCKLLSKKWFDKAHVFIGEYAVVGRAAPRSWWNYKYGVIDRSGKLVVKMKYDEVHASYHGSFVVRDGGKYNILGQNQKPLFNLWLDRILDFEKFIILAYKGKEKAIGWDLKDTTGWFDSVAYWPQYPILMVRQDNRFAYIREDGSVVSNQWFDEIHVPYAGWGRVKLNGRWNFVNIEGKYISDDWFAMAGDFYDGFAFVSKCDNGTQIRLYKDGSFEHPDN